MSFFTFFEHGLKRISPDPFVCMSGFMTLTAKTNQVIGFVLTAM
jgi:hypothetical protein